MISNPAKKRKIDLMLDMNAPKGARPWTPWSWIRPIVILVLGVAAYVICAGEGPALAVTAGGALMGTFHAILPRSSTSEGDDK